MKTQDTAPQVESGPADFEKEDIIWSGRKSVIPVIPDLIGIALALIALLYLENIIMRLDTSVADGFSSYPVASLFESYRTQVNWGLMATAFILMVDAIRRVLSAVLERYVITTERILKRTGILNPNFIQIELYRVLDMHVKQPFFLWIFGKGVLIVHSADVTRPRLQIVGVNTPLEVRDLLRSHKQKMKSEQGRVLEVLR